MDFELTDEQIELQRTARSVLERECPPSLAREALEKGDRAEALWATLCGLDWPVLAVPEAAGGLGLSWVEQALVVEELGRVAAPGPYLASVTQFLPSVLAATGADGARPWVEAVAAGGTGTMAVDEGAGTWAAADVAGTTVTPTGDGYSVNGTKRYVLDGAGADEIVVAGRLAGELALVVVPGAAATAEELAPIDGTTRHAHVTLEGVEISADRLLATGPAAESALEAGTELAATAVAASTVGTCQRILELVLAYVQEREQFGVPIGSFQAVKHRIVDMYRDVERARALAYFAALCAAERDPRRRIATAMAKAAAGEAQARVVQDGLQLFGGIGYTWENDLHLYLRRAQVGELHLGSSALHRRRVAELFLSAEGPPT